MQYSEEPLVSVDIVGNPHSAIIDGLSTKVVGEDSNFLKIMALYGFRFAFSMAERSGTIILGALFRGGYI